MLISGSNVTRMAGRMKIHIMEEMMAPRESIPHIPRIRSMLETKETPSVALKIGRASCRERVCQYV